MKDTFLLFDIGGTRMRLAVSRDGKRIETPRVIDTPRTFSEGIEVIKRACDDLTQGASVTKVAGGIAGSLDRDRSELLASPNLPDWEKRPLQKELQDMIGAPVHLENDAAMAGLGEATAGAGKGKEIVAYITVSTGLGGARITHGKIDKRVYSFEPGHQIIDVRGEPCPYCRAPGHLETFVSGSGFKARYGEKFLEVAPPESWNEAARFLAYGLNNIIVHWSPDIVVVGGGMIMRSPSIPIDKVREHVATLLKMFPVPDIVKAELDDTSGLYGALAFLKQQ